MIKDCLEGECLTMVLACVNPGQAQYTETRNVLDFVHRASTIPLAQGGGGGNLEDWENMMIGRGYGMVEGLGLAAGCWLLAAGRWLLAASWLLTLLIAGR